MSYDVLKVSCVMPPHLPEEAGSRLLQRESRVRAAVESACIALRKERDERVKEVASIKVCVVCSVECLGDVIRDVISRSRRSLKLKAGQLAHG